MALSAATFIAGRAVSTAVRSDGTNLLTRHAGTEARRNTDQTTERDAWNRNLFNVATPSAPQWTMSLNQTPNRVFGMLFSVQELWIL